MDTPLTYEVLEDNAGGLYLFVFDGDKIKFGFENFEYSPVSLVGCLDELDNGAGENDVSGWEGQLPDPQADYASLTGHEFGWEPVARNTGSGRELFPDRMGVAATLELVDTQRGQS